MKVTKFHFSLKSEKDEAKPALIYVMFCLDKRYKLSIGESIPHKWWDAETERAIVSSQQKQAENRKSKRLNKILDNLSAQIEGLFKANYRWREVRPSVFGRTQSLMLVDTVRDYIKGIHEQEEKENEKKQMSPTEFFQNYCDNILPKRKNPHRGGIYISQGTITNHRIVLGRYKEYVRDKKLVDTFELFRNGYDDEMQNWLYDKKNYTPNTVCATFAIMKVWLGEAEKEGLITDKSFHQWNGKGFEVDRIYLTDDEIRRIYEIEFTDELKAQWHIDPKSSIEETRDLFIVGANTGLRLSDLSNLNSAQWLVGNNQMEDTPPLLIMKTQKTNAEVVIPLSDMVLAIYEKYNGKFPTPVYKSAYNRQIQKCAEIAKIDDEVMIEETKGGKSVKVPYKKYKLVCSHTARRSFATNLYLRNPDSRMIIQMTGHTTEENFKKYIRVGLIENAKNAAKFINALK